MRLEQKILEHYRDLKDSAGYLTLSRSWLRVGGEDRTTFLQNLTTNDVKRLEAGEGCEAFVTSVQGKTIGHVAIYQHSDCFFLETTADQGTTLLTHFDRYLITEDVQLEDLSGSHEHLFVGGAETPQHLEALGLPIPAKLLGHASSASPDALSVQRVPWTAHGWSITGGPERIAQCRSDLDRRGVAACDPDAFDSLRLEQGFPWFGQDIDQANLPQEVDRNDQAISFVKGCYLGQETVARIDAIGHVNRTLCGLTFPAEATVEVGTVLEQSGKQVGRVTSVGWSPLFDSPLALGYVRRGANEPGSQLQSAAGTATVVQLPAVPGE